MNPIQFKLAESRKSKSGEYPIYLRFYHSDTELVYPTGEKCQLSEWDAEKQKFRRSMAGYQQANEFLESLRERLMVGYRELRNNGLPITNETLRETLNAKKSPTVVYDLATLYEEYRQRCKAEGYAGSTIKSMGTTASRLNLWQRKQGKVNVTAYTSAKHKELIKFLYGEGLHPNSVGCVTKHLVTFLVFMMVYNVYGHLGWELYPARWHRHWLGRWMNTSVNHNQHHQFFRGNYGLYFRCWDEWMGTTRPDYEAAFERIAETRTADQKAAPVEAFN